MTIFSNIVDNARTKGIVRQNTIESIKWFRINIRKTAVDDNRLMRENSDNTVASWTNVGVGQIYLVRYDPKHKAKLKYYDEFPLIIPIERYKDGILGLNLHYLPPVLRAKALDMLYSTLNNDKFDESTKMKISYAILKNISGHKLFSNCIKRYLNSHFASRFIRIPKESWTAAIFLPVEKFKKESKQAVWKDSRRMGR